MSEVKSVNVTILGKEYLVACDEQETRLLNDAATLLNEKIQEVKTSSKIIGSERIAILTALNVTHEMLICKRSKAKYTVGMDEVVQRLRNKIDGALLIKDEQRKTEQVNDMR